MRKPAKRRAPTAVEREIQRATMQWLEAMGYAAAHVPNGAHLAGDARARAMQMAALKKDGLRPGFPDIIIYGKAPNAGVIEVKREAGGEADLSPDQEWWRDRLVARGWKWALVSGFVDDPGGAREALRGWGWIN